MIRPPPISIDDEEIRSDIKSDDVRKVYPDLPISFSWSNHCEIVKSRQQYLIMKDELAFQTIKKSYPKFQPPFRNKFVENVEHFAVRLKKKVYKSNPKKSNKRECVQVENS